MNLQSFNFNSQLIWSFVAFCLFFSDLFFSFSHQQENKNFCYMKEIWTQICVLGDDTQSQDLDGERDEKCIAMNLRPDRLLGQSGASCVCAKRKVRDINIVMKRSAHYNSIKMSVTMTLFLLLISFFSHSFMCSILGNRPLCTYGDGKWKLAFSHGLIIAFLWASSWTVGFCGGSFWVEQN